MGHLEEVQLSFSFPSLPSDFFDVQVLKILLSIISFEIIVASLQHYGLNPFFARCLIVVYKNSNFESVNALVEIEVSVTK